MRLEAGLHQALLVLINHPGMAPVEIFELRAIGLVLSRLEALMAVKSRAATAETHRCCMPVEDFGERRSSHDVLPLYGQKVVAARQCKIVR